ncbi:flagellar hook assembly protein FlgD [Peribacillus huizhouensis]|uniref:Basal-body rod modification protein FlgD n=1 Tax=Peribacillus huizhouensis TaxID=1501239 RepID=A0ABR6CIM8_9BACI|nr:flagellar hook assembly protein FlgD [Peribacillus huizhouensis]MBA9024865.1 flagellar basal-body rod modification protein FlgD [Peribacillus huizhouensis]
MTTIDTSLLLSNNPKNKVTTKGDTLGKDDFLKLLMAQLQNQDPTSPMDNTAFVSQMATFSSLEQMTNIGTGINSLIDIQQQNSLLAYNNFVGKEVTWHKINTDDSGETGEIKVEEGTGVVSSLEYKNNGVTFILEDGTKLEPGNISKLNATSSSNSLLSASELIGKLVTYLSSENEEVSAIVKSVLVKDGKTVYELADEKSTKLTADQLIKISSP